MTTEDEQKVVVPGEILNDFICDNKSANKKIILGPGIRKEGHLNICSKAGLLKSKQSPDAYWVDSIQKRYVPAKGERVLGIVVSKGTFSVRVDIGTNDNANLNLLAFEGATKKNRPDINVGDLVFARILNAGKDIETELVCVTSRGKKEGLGVLAQNGYMIKLPIHTVRNLLKPESELFDYLGIKFKFESAIGLNGRIWVKAASLQSTLFIINTLKKLEHTDEKELISELGF